MDGQKTGETLANFSRDYMQSSDYMLGPKERVLIVGWRPKVTEIYRHSDKKKKKTNHATHMFKFNNILTCTY